MTAAAPQSESREDGHRRVLHVVVGHGLRSYFVNAVTSLCAVAPDDDVLVVDNASPDPVLVAELAHLATGSERVRLLRRTANDLDRNGKVGSLYDAYREAFDLALDERYDYVHLVQGDMQVLWWDDVVVARAEAIFEAWPRCVNVATCLLSVNRAQSDALERVSGARELRLRHYGLTDTGLFHLGRWRAEQMSFATSETEHAARYLEAGFSVVCHPWPTDAQIPWPAVVRRGRQIGREVVPVEPYLLRPLGADDIEEMTGRSWTWLEDVCVPWGWTCLTPMWTADLGTADYWAARLHDARTRGVRASWPRWERRGIDASRRWVARPQHRPSLVRLGAVVPTAELGRRLARLAASAGPRARALAARQAGARRQVSGARAVLVRALGGPGAQRLPGRRVASRTTDRAGAQ